LSLDFFATSLCTEAVGVRAPETDQFCALIATGSYFSNLTLKLDYGQKDKSLASVDSQLQKDNTEVAALNSVVAALNYLSSHGWEYLSSSTLQNEVSRLGGISSQVQYLFRKRR
jgi:hypothetical protein